MLLSASLRIIERKLKASAFSDLCAVLQDNFKSAVAIAASTPIDNVVVNSKKEKTTARRVSRKLLATSVEIDFSVKVADAAAAGALVASDRLSKANLDAQLILQVFVRSYIHTYRYIHAYTYMYKYTDFWYVYIHIYINIHTLL